MDYLVVNRTTYWDGTCDRSLGRNLSGGDKYSRTDAYIFAETFWGHRGLCFCDALVP